MIKKVALTKVKGSVWDSDDNGLGVNVKDFGADPGSFVAFVLLAIVIFGGIYYWKKRNK